MPMSRIVQGDTASMSSAIDTLLHMLLHIHAAEWFGKENCERLLQFFVHQGQLKLYSVHYLAFVRDSLFISMWKELNRQHAMEFNQFEGRLVVPHWHGASKELAHDYRN